jgi:pimeloyl-ACP methyl ester carboxylesterase
MLTRRSLLRGAAFIVVAGALRPSFAADAPVPIVFVHGDSDQAAIWQTAIWRFESNGYPRDRLFAIDFTDPQARDDDTVTQPDRSSTQDQLRELTAFIDGVKKQTGSEKVAIVALSRGGYSTRQYVAANPASVLCAALGGTPNHGVFAIDALLGSQYNGRGSFLKQLNAGDSEVTAGVPFLTLRSDGFDLYAFPDGRYIGHPELPTNVTAEGPALKGATNLVLGQVDHRETACSPRAFAEIYKFIVGRSPDRIAVTPEAEVTLNGMVTGRVGVTPTNRPVGGALVEIYRVSPETGERQGGPAHSKKTGADGIWGPTKLDSQSPLEFVISAPDAPITHIYRSALPRSFALLNLRPSPQAAKEDGDAAAIVTMSRPRGYFGLPRDIVLLDGKEPNDIPRGVPAAWVTKLKLTDATARPILAEFNEERIVARPWPLKDNHMTIAELTY